MRVVFMGTPEFAVPSLRALHGARYDVAAVVSQPDRPRGRGRHLEPPPVARAARDLGLPLLQPDRVNEPAVLDQLEALAPDAVVVAAFGQILRKRLLEMPPLGCINVHASLLPRHRGGAPVQHALLAGDRETGITIMRMDEGLDTGPILLQERVAIEPDDTAGSLLERLSHVAAALLLRALAALEEGRLQPTAQDASLATLAPNLTREDACIDWRRAAEAIRNQVRALNPRPGAWTTLRGRELKVWWADVEPGAPRGAPGEVVTTGPRGILVAAGEDNLWLRDVQEAGKARMPAEAFARGAHVKPGDRFEAHAREAAEIRTDTPSDVSRS